MGNIARRLLVGVGGDEIKNRMECDFICDEKLWSICALKNLGGWRMMVCVLK
jgi:hypothetical protein